MSYNNILSNKKMSEIIKTITEAETDDKEDGIPDIALIFSADPYNEKIDVVIIELKKKGLPIGDVYKVVSQLRKVE